MDSPSISNGDFIPKINHGLTMAKPLYLLHKNVTKIKSLTYDRHYEVDLGIVLSGRLCGIHSDHKIIYKSGQVWLTGIWEPHGFELTQPPCEILNIFILPEYLEAVYSGKLLDYNLLTPFVVPPEDRPTVCAKDQKTILYIAQKLIGLDRQTTLYQVNMAKSYLLVLLMLLLKDWIPPTHKSQVSTDSYIKISPALHLLFTRRTGVSGPEAAKACNMTFEMFNKLFRQVMNVYFIDYAREYRLKGVMNDMVNTQKMLKTIAYEWGFSHPSHLDRCFHRQFGCSPSEFLNGQNKQDKIKKHLRQRRRERAKAQSNKFEV
jgi:AraC-like DNA-binding protein